ncbi:MAG: hypothetical protein CL992_02835, partial [Euryarchaeota archaeon]|nr:hypothetical protein [Euryarchaeota archaeon]
EYREWTWGGIEDPYGGSTRTMWEEKLVHEEMRNEVKAYVTTHPEESPRICTNYAVMFIWYEYPEGRRHYWMDSIERHWGNCEFIIYSKYWVGDNLQHEGVEHLYQIWHGAEDERFKAIRPQQCHEVECHLMAFKVLK